MIESNYNQMPDKRFGITIKIIIISLMINALFSGVDFSQLGMPKGISSMADAILKLFLAMILLTIYKNKNRYYIILIATAFALLTGFLTGVYYHNDEYSKSLSFVLNLYLWLIIYFYAFKIESNIKLWHSLLTIIIATTIISLLLYFLALFGVNTKILSGAWLYDHNMRFSSTFSEPSLSGYFFGLMFLLIFFSRHKHRIKLSCLFFFVTVLSGAKFTLVILPLILMLNVIFKFRGVFRKVYLLLPLIIFAAYASLAAIYPQLFSILSNSKEPSATMTYVTRFGFPITSISQLQDYPLGTGFYGYKTTLEPFIDDYCRSLNGINVICSEMSSYVDPKNASAYEDFAPKDVLSFIVLTFGFPGLLFFIIISFGIALTFRERKGLFLIYMYILSSMLFVLPFRFILFFSLFLFQVYIYHEKRRFMYYTKPC
ncbi:oligosaccharide repeat unit polymerase [Rahnella inusitata]|uniref:oligosaccharide repeat unit polymerase n=1 Tax=Rahnella inusitata TaxID=58169 RepID=UPI0039B09E46